MLTALTALSVALLGALFKGAFLDATLLFIEELSHATLSEALSWPSLTLAVLLITVGVVGFLYAVVAAKLFASALATVRGRPSLID